MGHAWSRWAVRLAALVTLAIAALFAPSIADAALSWSQPIAVDHNGQQRLAGLACSSGTRCVAIDGLGQTVTFNPASPSGAAPVVRSANATLLGIACPSDNQCTVVDSGGHAITFDPASSGGATTATITSAPGGLVSIACPGVHQCTTLDQSGNVETFDPTSPGTVTPVLIDATNGPAAIQCPSTGECVALFNNLGAHTSHAVAFDPGSPATQTSNNLTVFLVDMSCPSITRCTAVAPLSGEQYSFDPTKTTAPDHSTIDSGHELMRVACSVSTQCTAVDTAGQEVSFDPTVPSALTPVFLGAGSLNGIACPTSSQCTAVGDLGQEATFNPTTTTAPSAVTVDPSNELTGVACPSASQCTAIDRVGQIVTFDPSTLSTHTPLRIDGTRGLTSISCPSSGQCTTVDFLGDALTFDPVTPGAPTPSVITGNILPGGLSCPSLGQCTLVDFAGETTFDPHAPASKSSVVIGGGANYVDTSCPTSGQCTVVNASGQAATFNPAFPGSPSAVAIDGSTGIAGVSCPSTTLCVAADAAGRVIVFDPKNLGGASAHTIDSGLPFTDIACPSTTFCVASDAAGDVVEGNPATATWTHDPVPSSGALRSVACASDAECVVVDGTGRAFVGVPLPTVSSAPSITGTAVKGQTLSGQHGTWSSAPTGYAYAWQRCDTAGNNCTAIAGAAGTSYTLAAADVGHTIRVRVTASNIVGAGAPALSPATAVVQASGSPVIRTRPRVTGKARLGAQLSVTTGTWSGVGPISFSYHWQVCRPACSNIATATRNTLRLTAAQAGFRVRVIVTARNGFGTTSATSDRSGPISPTAAQIRTALLRAAVPTGLNARIAAILARGGVTVSFAAPAAGAGQLAWYYVPRGTHLAAARKPTLVASGRMSTTRARRIHVRLKLTGPGRRLLRLANSRTLTATATYTLRGGLRATARQAIVLR